MMQYYAVSTKGQVIESYDGMPSMETLQELANECKTDLWVIEGQHSGITVQQQGETGQQILEKHASLFGLEKRDGRWAEK